MQGAFGRFASGTTHDQQPKAARGIGAFTLCNASYWCNKSFSPENHAKKQYVAAAYHQAKRGTLHAISSMRAATEMKKAIFLKLLLKGLRNEEHQ
jgi:hypothetical protein